MMMCAWTHITYPTEQYMAQENTRGSLTQFDMMSISLSTQKTALSCVQKVLVLSLGISDIWSFFRCHNTGFQGDSLSWKEPDRRQSWGHIQQQDNQDFQAILSCTASSRRIALAIWDSVFKKKKRKESRLKEQVPCVHGLHFCCRLSYNHSIQMLARESFHQQHLINECACVPTKLYLWTLRFEFHIWNFTCHEILSFF